ncbi:MAG: hypothetical protein A2373_02000 [Candidatus Magasanikbacteria bacterium RIFOXYB1_FULL_40_15]|uniref:Anti-sigma factor n=2 Tax=Candidatus Magasanikiibacteriota TaxID=1752731 RepID=A0A1F6NJF1_9BACT|nr:MAG: hypothetical protein A2373_02000 [Candidatus Magasanikbacteria bacterium RIFOXYB1_FULL_40_15]OGH87202.1 MAG: hypothetical protein A2206_00715 [Candidatus Magasanikbacteria bacterium RIFOXYA1_FULL_40_8]
MKKSKILLILAGVVVVLVGIVFFIFSDKDKNEDNFTDSVNNLKQILGDQALAQKMRDTENSADAKKREVVGVQRGIVMSEIDYTHQAMLADVTGGKAGGIVNTAYDNRIYYLSASFAELPELKNGDFYEGWLVKQEPFSFVSVGKAEKLGGVYSNIYKSETDLMGYDFYVLTLEPDDGDPSSAVHVLEGYLMKK